MNQARSLAVLVTVSLAFAGCSSGGGSSAPPAGGGTGGGAGSAVTSGSATGTGSSSSSSSSTAAATGTSGSSGTGSGSTGASTTGAMFTITSPARGAFLSGSNQVTLQGTAASGVTSITVNGQAATLSSGVWSLAATLDFGVNIFVLRATDGSGKVEHTSWAVEYSPSYLDAAHAVPNSAAARISQNAISKLTPVLVQALTASGQLTRAVAAAASAAGASAIRKLDFGNPTVTVTLVSGGIETAIDVPNVDVDATLGGFPIQFSATDATIDGVLDVSVAHGAFSATMPNPPAVHLTGFNSSLGGPALQPIAETAIALAIQTALPPAVTTALNSMTQPRTLAAPGGLGSVTFEATPSSLSIDPVNFKGSGDANVSATVSWSQPRTGPGSASRNGGTAAAPTFATQHDVSLSVHEDLVNRAFYATWASGAMSLRVDQQLLTKLGIPLPVPLDASVLVPFFPALASLNPSGGPMPIAFEVSAELPPVVEVSGSPSLVTTGVGEVHVGLQLELASGWTDVLTFAAHGKLGTTVAVTPANELKLSIGQPVDVAADLLVNPFGLTTPDIDQFLATAVPAAVQMVGSMLPAIPLPAIPGGISPHNLSIYQDGAGGDFLTVEGDL